MICSTWGKKSRGLATTMVHMLATGGWFLCSCASKSRTKTINVSPLLLPNALA